MKHLSAFAVACLTLTAAAQCPFDPTVSPDNIILCPNEDVLLGTEVYDAYQWYKDGILIPGDTDQTHLATFYNDAGSTFSVAATLNGCTEMSPDVLVDGWAFLLPYVIHAGDPSLYTDNMGVPHYCLGDTAVLIFSFQDNVQWTNYGVDIPGATNDSLLVTETGLYSGSGAPSVCPDFIMQLGVNIQLVFDPPVQPIITAVDNQLCASPAGVSYQWYLDGSPLLGSTACITAVSEGVYTVDVAYASDCSILSAPFVITGIGAPMTHNTSAVFPVPARDHVTINWPGSAAVHDWQLQDATGRVVMRSTSPSSSPLVLDLTGISTGRYWISAADQHPLPITVVK